MIGGAPIGWTTIGGTYQYSAAPPAPPTSVAAYTVSLSVKDSTASQGRLTGVTGVGATGH